MPFIDLTITVMTIRGPNEPNPLTIHITPPPRPAEALSPFSAFTIVVCFLSVTRDKGLAENNRFGDASGGLFVSGSRYWGLWLGGWVALVRESERV